MESIIVSIISVVIAGIALGFSIFSHVRMEKQNDRIKNVSIKAKYFETIFDSFLIKAVPEKRSLIRFDERGYLADFQPLIDELSEMRNAAMYFRYDNKGFFDELKESIRNVEDFLSDEGNREHDTDEQMETMMEIANRIARLYACINKYYLGL